MPWHFGPFRLDLAQAGLWCAEQLVPLRPKAMALLAYLVTHPDRLVTKDELLEAVWPETAVSDAVVRVAIGALRKVLGDTAQTPRFIATVSRRGYRFLAPVAEYTGAAPGPASRRSPAALQPPAVEPPGALDTLPPTADASPSGATPSPPPCHRRQPNAATSPCCSAIWWTRPAGGAPGPGRLPGGGACLPPDLCRGDSAL